MNYDHNPIHSSNPRKGQPTKSRHEDFYHTRKHLQLLIITNTPCSLTRDFRSVGSSLNSLSSLLRTHKISFSLSLSLYQMLLLCLFPGLCCSVQETDPPLLKSGRAWVSNSEATREKQRDMDKSDIARRDNKSTSEMFSHTSP